MLTEEWKRLAGVYATAANAVRAADYDKRVSDAEYGKLVAVREQAYAALAAQSNRERLEQLEVSA
jgi:hypothetical protein